MKKKLLSLKMILIIFSSILFIDSSFSQKITGTVSDATTGEPIFGASVYAKSNVTGGVSTDFDGKYSLAATSENIVVVSSVGYVTKEIAVGSQTTIDFKLESDNVQINDVMVIGTRNPKRTSTESIVPVDVIVMKDISSLGSQTSVNDIMNFVAPSFTSQPQTVSDGTDHIDPASLRNLGPDQVLVLINGKRRHTSALINVNGTVGAGSVGTDMNAIPTAAIDRIEVLRDGAAAQYGSDAIAGIINIVLKKGTNKFDFTASAGTNASKNGNNHQGGLDGQTLNIGVNYGLDIGKKGGFVNFTGSVAVREPSSRAKAYAGGVFDAFHGAERVFAANGGIVDTMGLSDYQTAAASLDYLSAADRATVAGLVGFDSTNTYIIRDVLGTYNKEYDDAEIAARKMDRKDFSFRVGQSKLREGKFFANFSLPLGEHAELYSFGGVSYRQGLASGFYRRPAQGDGRANTPAFPNGFLPNIGSDITDQSIAIGIRGELKGWKIDFSNTFGSNRFAYTISNSSNGTMGLATPREFYAGANQFSQNTLNLDFNKNFEKVLSGLSLGFGSEFRMENFVVEAGEEASWANYDIYGNIVNGATPDANLVTNNFTGKPLGGGAQVFRGFLPGNEVDKNRNSMAAYVDAELDLTKKFIVSGAARLESYSDFGETLNWKFATRYNFSKAFSLRGAVSTGFRAPSLHQKYFSRTSTIFDANGIAQEEGTFANNSRAAELLGIPELKEETSINGSFGFTSRLRKLGISLTVDAYYIKIKDRIVYTGSFKAGDDAELQAIFNAAGATKARFFANAINTESMGIDLVISHKLRMDNGITLKNDFSGTISKTQQVDAIKATGKLANQTSTFFGTREKLFLEAARPNLKLNLTNIVEYKSLSFMIRNVYFGQVTDPDSHADAELVVYAGKVITDLSIAYKFTENFKVTIGSNNLLDIYPDANRVKSTSGDQFVYSRRTSQFGYTGRYLFARVNFNF